MRRRHATVLLLALAGCHRDGGAPAAPPAPAVRGIDATDVKAGALYRFRLAHGDFLTLEIVGKDDDDAVFFRRHLETSGHEVVSDRESFSLRRELVEERPEAETSRRLPDEVLQISGRSFPCQVHETQAGGTAVRTWRSTSFPEEIKTQVGADVTAELVEIR